jgi:hypothetical protein
MVVEVATVIEEAMAVLDVMEVVKAMAVVEVIEAEPIQTHMLIFLTSRKKLWHGKC